MKIQSRTYIFISFILCLASISCAAQIEIPQLIAYSSSECEDVYFGNRHNIQNRILNHSITDSSQVYKIVVVTHCERTVEGKIEFKNDTLKLMHHGAWEFSEEIENSNDSIIIVTEIRIEALVECDCVYELRYEISGLNAQPKVVTLNDEIITNTKHKYKVRRQAPKFKMVNKDTINLIDIYGLKQKNHVTTRQDGKLVSNVFYEDAKPLSGLARVRYNVNGFDRIELHLENGNYTKRKYYKNEKLFKTCDTKGAFDDDTNCTFTE